MKAANLVCSISLIGFLFAVTLGCEQISSGNSIPTITTTAARSVTITGATLGGNITADGGAAVIEKGVVYATTQSPTAANNKAVFGGGSMGSFGLNITGLVAGTTYYFRAFAENSTGIAYGSQETFKTSPASSGIIADIDNNTYSTVTIGTQVWMASNLKTTLLKDGTAIPLVTNSATWSLLTTPGYCWYNHEAANKSTYGALYNWHTVNTGKLCPTGWHVPSDAEWTKLVAYFDGDNIEGKYVVGGSLKEIGADHWKAPNTGANNTTGFTALPGGARFDLGSFYDIGNNGYWWSSTEAASSVAWNPTLHYSSPYIDILVIDKRMGFSVRCLKD